MSFLFRRPGTLIVLGTSALGGAAYRFVKPTSSSDASLNPQTFTPYTLVEKQPVSSTSTIFTLRNCNGTAEPESVREVWKRSVWSIQIKQPQLQIARAYTPLPPSSPSPKRADGEPEPENIRLLIRQEKGGEVSTYLHRLPEQSTIEIRGPNVESELPHDIKEVVFLAGGTGIAPAMQVAQALSRRTGSRMDILWANRRREECVGGVSEAGETQQIEQTRLGWWKSLFGMGNQVTQEASVVRTAVTDPTTQGRGIIVQELDALKERCNVQNQVLSVQYYVDEENTFIRPTDLVKRLGSGVQGKKGSKVILVSGPEGFIEHWAGKKVWAGGREGQGPLGGVLGQMDLKGWSVLKL
ncbi:hypothetical protein K491DRAFT_722436 [Lophiostoma macrostomum CBS 122681]|uniref:FAD-binding FR-type domain-containing protein n=1 Tax=Lophiostoma macrostomum CBS 122681 TaxID=1314788 RepID=A0A6A6SNP0_9PLEO|nr:hypothetical protein K491DRAFT_722436 [Lophiostoma macrostomum CBS 122681]